MAQPFQEPQEAPPSRPSDRGADASGLEYPYQDPCRPTGPQIVAHLVAQNDLLRYEVARLEAEVERLEREKRELWLRRWV